MTLSLQFITMIAMVGSGIYLGIALDTFRRLLRSIKIQQALEFTLEIIFWIAQAIILFYILFLVNAGELRVYIFLACLLGFATYQALLKKMYLSVLEYLLKIVTGVIRFIYRIIEILIITPIILLFSLCVKLLYFFYRILSYVFMPVWKLIYFPFRPLTKKITGFLHKIKGIYSTIKQTLKK